MRDEKRRRTRDDDPVPSKKKREESPAAPYPPACTSSSKSRNHMPVSERQQVALLKLMETKQSTFDCGVKQTWETHHRDSSEFEKPSSSTSKSQHTTASTDVSSDSLSAVHGTQVQDLSAHLLKSPSIHAYPHCQQANSHSSTTSSQHLSLRKPTSHQHRVGGTETALMRASKRGDLLTVQMLVKDGVNINQQNAMGRSALHESSANNHHSVSVYLLKHNANPNLKALSRANMGSGDTPLHEASREGHIRVVRTLLRYGADPDVCNATGDNPIDVCCSGSCQAVFRQLNELRNHPSGSKSPTLDRHDQRRSSITEEKQISGSVKQPSSPEHSMPEPVYGHSQQKNMSNSPLSLSQQHHQHLHRKASQCTVRRNTAPSSTSASVCSNEAKSEVGSNVSLLSRLKTKKDPYAFDDEELEASPQQYSENSSRVPPSLDVPSSSVASPSESGHLSTQGLLPNGPIFLHSNASTLNDPSNNVPFAATSPSSCGGGPPLKLRFAIEAGHYTVMDNQEIQTEQISANTPLIYLDAKSVNEGSLGDTIDDPLPATVCLTGEINSSDPLNLKSEAKPNSLDSVYSASEKIIALSEGTDDRDGDSNNNNNDGRSPKVPPLRIKLGNNTPPIHSHQVYSPSNEQIQRIYDETDSKKQYELNIDCEIKPVASGCDLSTPGHQRSCKSEPLVDGSVDDIKEHHEGIGLAKSDQDDAELTWNEECPEKRLLDDSSTSSNHLKRLAGKGIHRAASPPTFLTGKLPNESNPPKQQVADSSEAKMKILDASKPRSFRTLRSHTAAQREREEREKHVDLAPLKKRKYRTKTGGCGHGGAAGSSTVVGNTNNDHQRVGGSDVDIEGKLTDHEDAIITATNADVSLQPTSAASTAVGDSTTVDEDPYLVDGACEANAPAHDGNKPHRSFDDSIKTSAFVWGENPYDKAAELNRGLTELIGKLVELQPKEPTGYQDYLLVTRDYHLAGRIPQQLSRHQCPPELPSALAELYEEQEVERYTQSLKHQSEREQLRLCAEQSVLRAQTRATIALANQPRPLSFCSVMAFKGFTYLPPFKGPEHRDEESVRDRFKARTLIGWLQDIKDNFQIEKRKLLCRQLHEAESLMMVQKLDWEVKLKELHLFDYRANILDEIPSRHVPLIDVPGDFPLFVHDPIQRPS